METHTLSRLIQTQHAQGVFEKKALVIPEENISDDGDESDEVDATPKRGKKAEVTTKKRKATRMSFIVAAKRELLLVMNSANVIHLIAGDVFSIHKTSRKHTVAITLTRNSLPVEVFGHQIDTTCRDIKEMYPR
jgi:hypothetical protein